MKHPKISIIIPVYNVENYIDKCLNSLVSQTLKDIEIIVVNDGSPDNSQEIIDKYAKKYKIVKSFIKENGGLSDARNFGIKKAKGDYITFVDSDDYVSKDMYEKLYKKAIKKQFDIVVCDAYMVYPNKKVQVTSGIEKDLLSKKEIKENFIKFYPSAWNKIYKKELFDNIEYKKGIWYEDVECFFRLLADVGTVGVIHEPLYYYVQRDGAITSTFNEKIYDYVGNLNSIVDYYKKLGLYDKYQDELEFIYVRYIYATMMKGLCKLSNKEKFNYGLDLAIKNVSNYFPNYKNNKYLKKFSLKNFYLKHFNKLIANTLRMVIK